MFLIFYFSSFIYIFHLSGASPPLFAFQKLLFLWKKKKHLFFFLLWFWKVISLLIKKNYCFPFCTLLIFICILQKPAADDFNIMICAVSWKLKFWAGHIDVRWHFFFPAFTLCSVVDLTNHNSLYRTSMKLSSNDPSNLRTVTGGPQKLSYREFMPLVWQVCCHHWFVFMN